MSRLRLFQIVVSRCAVVPRFCKELHTCAVQVFDLNDWENSRWAYFPGVSGWVGSKHFGDTAEFLEDGKGTDAGAPLVQGCGQHRIVALISTPPSLTSRVCAIREEILTWLVPIRGECTEKLFPMPWDEEKIEASLVANKVLHPKRHKQQPLEQRQKAQRQQDKQEF